MFRFLKLLLKKNVDMFIREFLFLNNYCCSKSSLRKCHIESCGELYKNVTHHRKKHPEVPKEEFYYSTQAKVKGLVEFKGYQCCICKRAVKHLKQHLQKMHPDIKYEDYEDIQLRSNVNSDILSKHLSEYKEMLVVTGVGKNISL